MKGKKTNNIKYSVYKIKKYIHHYVKINKIYKY